MEIVAAHLVLHQHVAQPHAELVEQAAQQVDRVLARVHHMPVVDGHAGHVGQVEHAGLLDPLHERGVRLRGQVHQHAAAGLLDRAFHDGVHRFVAIGQRRCGIAGVEAHQCAVRAIGVVADEGHLVVDEVLRQQPRDQRLADAAFLAADQVDLRAGGRFEGGNGIHGADSAPIGGADLRHLAYWPVCPRPLTCAGLPSFHNRSARP